MFSRPLARRRIVVTRAAAQAAPLLDQLRALGADAVSLPVIRLEPPSDPAPLARARRELAGYDGVIFTSANAVAGLLDGIALDRLPHRPCICAIGPATAQALKDRGWKPDLTAADARSEGVVAALDRHAVAGRRWLLPRAEQGREVIVEALRQRGVALTLVATHRTVAAHESSPAARALFPGADAAILTSPSTARALTELLGDGYLDRLHGAALAVIGPVTRAAAGQLGLDVAVEASEPSPEALVRALAGHFDPDWRRA